MTHITYFVHGTTKAKAGNKPLPKTGAKVKPGSLGGITSYTRRFHLLKHIDGYEAVRAILEAKLDPEKMAELKSLFRPL